MDCKTAQLMLDYSRPQAADLVAEDARALDDHLSQCSDCSAHAKHERRLDEHLARAMKAVEVPDRLRDHLLARLDAERGDWYRRRIGSVVRYAAAVAACVVFVAGGAYGWWSYRYANRPVPDIDALRAEVDPRNKTLDRAKVEQEFKERYGVIAVLPDFQYGYYYGGSMREIQGERVPQVEFNLFSDGVLCESATVLVLSDKQFNLTKMKPGDPSSGYQPKVDVLHTPNGPYAYVIVYTGKNYDWLKKPQ